MKKKHAPTPDPCPCGSGQTLAACCGPYLAGQAAPDAETLMRSRYTAYCLEDVAYLRATWHPDTCPADLDLATEPRPNWLGLTVHAHAAQDADHATVAFTARYKIGGRAHRLHEVSRFVRIDGCWLYLDGEVE